MLRSLRILIILLTGLAATASYGLSEPFPASPAGTLFADENALNIELDAPLKDLFEKHDPSSKEKVYAPGKLSYFDGQNKKITLPVRVRVKGNSSAKICPFKKVELKWKSADAQQTLFAGMKSIDLNTHCAEPGELDDEDFSASFYNHREVLMYQMAKILRIPTFQARAVFIRYKNTGLKADNAKNAYQAFFIEDKGDFLERTQSQEIKIAPNTESKLTDIRTYHEIDAEDLYRSALFNTLIQNSDWGFPLGNNPTEELWNIKIIETQSGKWVPLTGDFSLAAPVVGHENDIVNIENLNLVDANGKAHVLASFIKKKSELYHLLETIQNDKPAYHTLKTCLDKFFAAR